MVPILTPKNSDGTTACDLINGLPDYISETFKVTIAKASQTMQGANHVLDTEMSGRGDIVHPRGKGKKERSESQGAMGE